MKRILLVVFVGLLFSFFFFLQSGNKRLEQIVGSDVTSLESGNLTISGSETADNESDNTKDPGIKFNLGDILPVIPGPIKIFGVVVDENNQPIDNALVSDEISGQGSRSDSSGYYQIYIEPPKFKNPLLNFLRSGYKGKRIGISAEEFKNKAEVKIDVTLIEATDTTTLQGWIRNDIGAGLANQKIRLVSRGGLGPGSVFYVIHSDDKGDFSFEGIRSGLSYKLEVYPPPGYSGFVIHVLNVTQYTPRLDIVLDRLNLIELRGMVVNREATPVPDFKMLLESISTNYPVQTVITDSSGFYSLDNFPLGEVKFSTLAPEYFRISGMMLDRNEAQNLILIVDKGSFYLSGWVSDNNGIPLESARVTLDSNYIDGEIKSYSYRSIHTDNAGTFIFSDLGNYDHLITVYAEGYKKEEIMHSFNTPSDNVHITVTRSQ
jgi:hypothetical protein